MMKNHTVSALRDDFYNKTGQNIHHVLYVYYHECLCKDLDLSGNLLQSARVLKTATQDPLQTEVQLPTWPQ